jgi:predicted GTPase
VADPRPAAAPAIRKIFDTYPHIGNVLPAVGYNAEQLVALQATINGASVDAVVSATPADLGRLLHLDMPVVRARYAFAETDQPRLSSIVDAFVDESLGDGGR